MRKITNSNDNSIFLGLGSSLLSDIGNYEEAVGMFKMAADIGNPEAQYKLAYMYIKGLGCEKNEDEADKLFTLSFRKYSELANYDSKAQYYISLMYFNGYGIPKDDEMAFKYCEKSVKNGYEDALLDLGKMYVEGIGTKNNYKKGFDCFKKSVDNNNIEAKYCLGLMYKLGIGVRQDEKIADELLKESFKYYKKNEKKEINFILLHLAFMYLEGLGTKQDYKKAIKCYKKIAKNGDSNAQFLVGLICYYGLFDCNQDYKKAKKWFKISARQGNMEAKLIIADMYFEGNGTIQNYKIAFNRYLKLSKKGNIEAKFNLGLMYYFGLGIHQNIKKADKYFTQSCDIYEKLSEYNICANLRLFTKKLLIFHNDCLIRGKINNYFLADNEILDFILGIILSFNFLDFYKKKTEQELFISKSNIYRISRYFEVSPYISHNNLLNHFKKNKFKLYNDFFEQFLVGLFNIDNINYSNNYVSKYAYSIAQFILADKYYYGKGVEQDYNKAFELLCKSAENGLRDAQYKLAGMYFEGKSVEQDYKKAFEWYKKSVKQENPLGQFMIGKMYFEGKGVEQDYKKAFECLNKSAKHGCIKALYYLCKYYLENHNYIISLVIFLKYIFLCFINYSLISYFIRVIFVIFCSIVSIIYSIIRFFSFKNVYSFIKMLLFDNFFCGDFFYIERNKILSRDLLNQLNWSYVFEITKLYERFLKD